MFILMLLMACGPKKPVEEPPQPVDSTANPVLPALEAPAYAERQTLPSDELVAQVALGMIWDEALSGASAALALSDAAPSLEAAQHAAHRAGFPYPVRVISSGMVDAGKHPDALLRTLHKVMGKSDRLGLARARKGMSDHWVALLSAPVDKLEPFEREQPLGAEVQIRAVGPGTWMAISPSGAVKSGRMPASIKLDEEGEWWLEVDGLHETIAAVPLFVGMKTPVSPVIDLPGETISGPVAAADEALLLVSSVREAFAMTSLRDDGTLETLAQYPLDLLLSGQWDR